MLRPTLPPLSAAARRLMRNGMAAMLMLVCHAACEQENYESGEGENSLLTAEIVEAEVGSTKTCATALLDDGRRIQLERAITASWMTKADTAYRAVLYYKKKPEGNEPVSIAPVLVPAIRRADTIKSGVKTDPVKLESIWKAKSGRWVNLSLNLLVGSTDDSDAVHLLGLVADTLMANADGTKTQHLRLYHDQGGMPEYYSYHVYLSIPLTIMAADTLAIGINTYDSLTLKRFPL